MTTGKTEGFDYKAHAEKTADRYRSFMDVTKLNVVDLPRPANPDSACKQIECLGELLRLQQVVVKAAKKWRHDKTFKSEGDLFNAVCALEAFEANQK